MTNTLPPLINLGKTVNPLLDQNKIAIVDWSQDSLRKFTFGDIEDYSNRVAVFLYSKGIVKGDKVAIISKNSFEYLVTLYGIFRIGAVAVPLNWKSTLETIELLINDCQAKLIFSDKTHNIPDSLDLHSTITTLPCSDYQEISSIDKNDNGLLLYTSGSSGTPKGVLIKHLSHLFVIKRARIKGQWWSDKRVSLISAPLYHMNGLSTLQGSIAGHSTVFLLPEFDAKKYLKLLDRYNINCLYVVTPMIAMLINEKPLVDSTDLSKVKVIHLASAPLSQKLYNDLTGYFPNAKLLNSYGCTEVGPGLFGQHPDPSIPKPPLSVGYPSKEIQTRIVNGVLQLKSPGMFSGYTNKPEQYKESITEDGFFITNDLFEVDENGFYFFQGRADDMFKSGGNTVYPSKIQEILEQHSGVKSACVIGVNDDIKGKKPYAFVLLNYQVSEENLKEFFLSQAEPYLLPRKIWVVESFPLTSTNKIDTKQLLKLAEEYLSNGS